MKKFFKLLLHLLRKSLLAIIFVIMCFTLALGFSTQGLRWLLSAVPKDVEIHGIHGQLFKTITIDALTYKNFHAKKVSFHWSWSNLHSINISPLTIDDLIITTSTTPIHLNNVMVQGTLGIDSLSDLTVTLGSGDLQNTFNYYGNLYDPLHQGKLTLNNISGQLAQQRFEAYGAISAIDGVISAQNFAIHLGEATVTLNGSSQETPGVSWNIRIPDLSRINPSATGSIEGKGNMVGALTQNTLPKFSGTLMLKNFAKGDTKIGDAILNLTSTTAQLHTSHINIQLSENTALQGDVYSSMKISHNLKNEFTTKATITTSALTYQKNHVLKKINIDPLTLDMTDAPKALQASIHSTTIHATLQLPKTHGAVDINNKTQPIYGNIQFGFHSLTLLPQLIHEIQSASGTLTGNIHIDGTIGTLLDQKTFSGNTKLNQGYLNIPKLGLTLKNIEITGDKKDAVLTLHTSLQSGEGTLTINGQTRFDQKGFPGDYTVSGKNVRLMNKQLFDIITKTTTDQLDITASPQARIKTQGTHVDVAEGELNDTIATITLPDNSHNYLTIPSEFHDQTPGQTTQKSSPIIWSLNNIAVNINEASSFKYIGINTKIKGRVIVNLTPGQAATGQGSLEAIHGSYDNYGIRLNDVTGRISFVQGNPLLNPSLSILSQKEIQLETTTGSNGQEQNIPTRATVGIAVTGNIKKPEVNFFSTDPNLKERNIAGYLSSGSASLSTTQAIGGVLSVFKPAKTAQGVGNQLQEALKLNTLTVGSVSVMNPITNTPIQNTSLIIGKNITPTLSVQYNVGLTQAINLLRVRLALSKHLSLIGENTTFENGADLFYHWWRY